MLTSMARRKRSYILIFRLKIHTFDSREAEHFIRKNSGKRSDTG
jgi:hypothetical protein